jgi:toxin ParE1/3/4
LKLRWTPKARQDRQEQLEFVAEDQPAAAVRLAEEIIAQTRLLIDHPEMGRVGRVSGTRELIVVRTPFVAIYRLQTVISKSFA